MDGIVTAGGSTVGGSELVATWVDTGGADGVAVGSSVVAVLIPEVDAAKGAGADTTAGGDAAAAVSTGAACPGGAQPGGGSKALFGSTRRAGTAATATGAGDGVIGVVVSVADGRSDVDVATVDDVVAVTVAGGGGAEATATGGSGATATGGVATAAD
jgi:hypothetical protein